VFVGFEIYFEIDMYLVFVCVVCSYCSVLCCQQSVFCVLCSVFCVNLPLLDVMFNFQCVSPSFIRHSNYYTGRCCTKGHRTTVNV